MEDGLFLEGMKWIDGKELYARIIGWKTEWFMIVEGEWIKEID